MPRPRLTDEEREEKRKARNRRGFTEAKFRQYDPGDGLGYGSEAQWRAAAGGGFSLGDGPPPKVDADLQTLGLTAMPTDGTALKAAFRTASFATHPDYGGSDAAFIAVKQAYTRLFDRL